MTVHNLTVHKNTLEKRKRKEVTKSLIRSVKNRNRNFDGYVLVTWDKKGEAEVCWERGGMYLSNMPGFVKNTIMRVVSVSDSILEISPERNEDPDDAS